MSTLLIAFLRMFTYVRGLEASINTLEARERALKDYIQMLEPHAFKDSLTGAMQRWRFTDLLKEALRECERTHSHIALLYLDLDGFKLINDTHGHGVGDAFLRLVAHKIVECAPGDAVICRMGGDEFSIFLTNPDGYTAISLAREMRECLENSHFRIEGEVMLQGATISLECKVSIGFATTKSCGYDSDRLIHAADQCMYGDKKSWRVRQKIRP